MEIENLAFMALRFSNWVREKEKIGQLENITGNSLQNFTGNSLQRINGLPTSDWI